VYLKNELNESVNERKNEVELSDKATDETLKSFAQIIIDYIINNKILVKDE
jgi:hypothetical protein